MRERIVILTGAGISAESGINTFRDAGGLWKPPHRGRGHRSSTTRMVCNCNRRREQLQNSDPVPPIGPWPSWSSRCPARCWW